MAHHPATAGVWLYHLRQVTDAREADYLTTPATRPAVIGYGLFTRGETSQIATAQLAIRCLVLRFLLQPGPAD